MPRPAPLAAVAFTTLCLAFAPARAAATPAGPLVAHAVTHAARGVAVLAEEPDGRWSPVRGDAVRNDEDLRRAAIGGCGWTDSVRAAADAARVRPAAATSRGTALLTATSTSVPPVVAVAEPAVTRRPLIAASSVDAADRIPADRHRVSLLAARSVPAGVTFARRPLVAVKPSRRAFRTVVLLTSVPVRTTVVAAESVRRREPVRRPLVAAKPVRVGRTDAVRTWTAAAVGHARGFARDLRAAANRRTIEAAVAGTVEGWRSLGDTLTGTADRWLRPSVTRAAETPAVTTVR